MQKFPAFQNKVLAYCFSEPPQLLIRKSRKIMQGQLEGIFENQKKKLNRKGIKHLCLEQGEYSIMDWYPYTGTINSRNTVHSLYTKSRLEGKKQTWQNLCFVLVKQIQMKGAMNSRVVDRTPTIDKYEQNNLQTSCNGL